MTITANLSPDELSAIASRVQKLLALSKSSNEHEAGLAAAKAQELLFRYNLDLAAVEQGSQLKDAYGRHYLTIGKGKVIEWQRDLIYTLARYNFGKAIMIEGTRSMVIIAQRHNFEVIAGMYDYLNATLARLVERAFTEYRLAGGADHHLTYKASWLLGAVAGIRSQLRAQQETSKAESEASMALVKVTDDALKTAVDDLMGKLSQRQQSSPKSTDGYGSGYETGKTIGLHKQVKQGAGTETKALTA